VSLTLLQLLVGLALVVFFAERLVGAVVGTAVGFGVSAFVVSVLFVGFDPENLAVGAAAAHRGIAGFALGSVVGAAMVAVALAFGLTAIITPMEFGQVPRRVVTVPVLAVLVLSGLGADGLLSRVDGVLLLLGFGAAVIWLIVSLRHGCARGAGRPSGARCRLSSDAVERTGAATGIGQQLADGARKTVRPGGAGRDQADGCGPPLARASVSA
jgi:Ca2+/Na+ antiporter